MVVELFAHTVGVVKNGPFLPNYSGPIRVNKNSHKSVGASHQHKYILNYCFRFKRNENFMPHQAVALRALQVIIRCHILDAINGHTTACLSFLWVLRNAALENLSSPTSRLQVSHRYPHMRSWEHLHQFYSHFTFVLGHLSEDIQGFFSFSKTCFTWMI